MKGTKLSVPGTAVALLFLGATPALAQVDPGVQGGAPRAGGFLPGLTENQELFFEVGREDFNEAEGVGDGLGPRFNLDSCGGCHIQPDIGGTSPAVNPQFDLATAFGARNTVPPFISRNGPVREARLKRLPNGQPDGGVHGLFVISQRSDDTGSASACNIVQPNFQQAIQQNNIIFRIPTPVFGAGLMETISDTEILRNLTEGQGTRSQLGITGRVNRNGNDGRITRFGWKAQNMSTEIFSGEAYNVEMGITSEQFPIERDETQACQTATVPNDVINTDGATGVDTVGAVSKFAFFMRFLAPPTQNQNSPGGNASIAEGFNAFVNIGCTHCHTQQLRTDPNATIPALANKNARMFSDLALHNMGPGLADDIAQGEARGDEFRTAPLWGLGQRIFFLHDGRTKNLLTAIQAHASNGNGTYQASEANAIINRFNGLSRNAKQNMLNFLRSL